MTLVATILGSSLAFIDVTVVIIAMPTIEKDLDLGLTGEQWIYLSYSLALASLYLVGGAVGDRLGRREVFMAAVAGFALASLLAAAGAERRRADRRAHAAGHRRRVRHDEQPRAAPGDVRERGGAGRRAVDVVHGRRHDRRAAGRRRAGRVGVVAVDLPPQPAGGRR